ncbi:MAG: hypothetical protein RR594_02100 [Clostridia bacterium]
MKFEQTDFRDLDRKWVGITTEKNINEIEIAMNEKNNGEIYLGYSYIDHFNGRAIILIGSSKKVLGKYEPTYKPKELSSKLTKIDDVYIKNAELDVEIIDKKQINKILVDVIEKYIFDEFYKNLSRDLHSLRKLASLDVNRAHHCPDNINIYLSKEGLKEENVWCKLEGKYKKNIKAILINSPSDEKYNIKRMDMLMLEYNKEKERYVCVRNIPPLKDSKEGYLVYKIDKTTETYFYGDNI